jgi:geranylgeranyl diphosphate synthase type II
LKTGAIIRSSCVIGAILANAGESEINAVDEFASNLGVAFQIRDDILDVVGDEKSLGKPIGSDEKSEKNTYVKLLGLEKSEKLVEEYSNKALDALDIFGEKAEFLKKLTNYLVNRVS